MDRGRVGLDASGNKAIRDYVLKSRKQEHLDRIRSIMNRPPGSSTTLDNRPPSLINALATNPKQKALKRDFNKITGRENKAMLKRIGKILTAPPLHTESDYERQKKKVPKEHTRKLEKLQIEIKKKAKLYFEQLKKTHGLYNVKDWENDYKKQLFHQKYIRQVNYQRPKDFIDPIVTEPVNNKQTNSPKHHNSSAHINRVRNIKSNSLSSDREYKGIYNVIEQGTKHIKKKNILKLTSILDSNIISSDINNYDSDEYEDDDEEEEPDITLDDGIVRKELSTIQRSIRILHDVEYLHHNSTNKTISNTEGDVSCWLVDNRLLLIIATANCIPNSIDKINGFIQAEADINLIDLVKINQTNYDINYLLNNDNELVNLANELVSNVDIKIENGTSRVLLNLSSNNKTTGDKHTDESVSYSDSYENEYEEYAFDNDWDNVKAKSNDLSIEDAIELMTSGTARKTISMKTIDLPIWSVNTQTIDSPSSNNNSPNNLRALASFYKVEDKPLDVVKAEVTAMVLGEEDEVNITAKMISSSKLTYNNHKILSIDSQLMSTTGLPSIVHIDPDLMNEFLQSIAEHLIIQYDKQTGQCSLILTSH